MKKISLLTGLSLTIIIVLSIGLVVSMLSNRATLSSNQELKKNLEICNQGFEDCTLKIKNPSKRNVIEMQEYISFRYKSVPKELAEIISIKTNEVCSENNIAFPLVVGLMEVESSFNPFSVSKVGARGLLQVMPKVWAEKMKIKSETDLHDIEFNINIGVEILKHYIDKNNGNITKALANYNGSTGTEFSNSVYTAVGKFTAFRTNSFLKKGNNQNEKEPSAGTPTKNIRVSSTND